MYLGGKGFSANSADRVPKTVSQTEMFRSGTNLKQLDCLALNY